MATFGEEFQVALSYLGLPAFISLFISAYQFSHLALKMAMMMQQEKGQIKEKFTTIPQFKV